MQLSTTNALCQSKHDSLHFMCIKSLMNPHLRWTTCDDLQNAVLLRRQELRLLCCCKLKNAQSISIDGATSCKNSFTCSINYLLCNPAERQHLRAEASIAAFSSGSWKGVNHLEVHEVPMQIVSSLKASQLECISSWQLPACVKALWRPSSLLNAAPLPLLKSDETRAFCAVLAETVWLVSLCRVLRPEWFSSWPFAVLRIQIQDRS